MGRNWDHTWAGHKNLRKRPPNLTLGRSGAKDDDLWTKREVDLESGQWEQKKHRGSQPGKGQNQVEGGLVLEVNSEIGRYLNLRIQRPKREAWSTYYCPSWEAASHSGLSQRPYHRTQIEAEWRRRPTRQRESWNSESSETIGQNERPVVQLQGGSRPEIRTV